MSKVFGKIIIAIMCFVFLYAPINGNCKQKDPPCSVPKKSIHANSWVFGQSEDRKDEIWHKGVTCKEIDRRAKKNFKTKATDTRSGINNALSKAENGNRRSFGLSMKDESSRWRSDPGCNSIRTDEDMVRERRHVFRAYADVQATKDLNIRVGPELIMKDERNGESAASAHDPDSVLGLGMNFKYDF